MFHKLLTYSTMTAVVLHALLGCCVHHAHADSTHSHSHGVDSAVVVEVGHNHGHCHHGHSHGEHSHESHQSSCQHPNNADGSITRDCFDDKAIELLPPDPCSGSPCSGSHGPHDSCDEADCHIVADQRDNDISLKLIYEWSPLLTHSMLLSSPDLVALWAEGGSPPDPHRVSPPLRVRTQVWRL